MNGRRKVTALVPREQREDKKQVEKKKGPRSASGNSHRLAHKLGPW